MKIVLNVCFGGFHIPQEFCEIHGLNQHDYIDRTNPDLVKFVELHGGVYEEGFSMLKVVEIPDDCTDWELNEYDGAESITYVVGGKLYHI